MADRDTFAADLCTWLSGRGHTCMIIHDDFVPQCDWCGYAVCKEITKQPESIKKVQLANNHTFC